MIPDTGSNRGMESLEATTQQKSDTFGRINFLLDNEVILGNETKKRRSLVRIKQGTLNLSVDNSLKDLLRGCEMMSYAGGLANECMNEGTD